MEIPQFSPENPKTEQMNGGVDKGITARRKGKTAASREGKNYADDEGNSRCRCRCGN